MRNSDLRRASLAAFVCAWSAACSHGGNAHGGAPPPVGACVDVAGFHCSNAVDGPLLPILAEEGVTPSLADDAELCRRYALDLTGVVPSFADYQAHCQGRQPGEMVDYFMSLPAYVANGQRSWADAFLYDNERTWYRYIADLDARVGDLYRGALDYPDFAAVAIAHPAFVGRFGGENVVSFAYQSFLGRDALPEERQDMLALYRMWRFRPASDPALTYATSGSCTTEQQCPAGSNCVAGTCTERTNYMEALIDPGECWPPFGAAFCTSVATGASVILPAAEPGGVDALTADQWETLRTPGRVIAGLPGFWETACDTVLKKYTGWWMTGHEPWRRELPSVRASLAAFFRGTGGAMRSLEREVLTSALYTMKASAADPNDSTEWHRGPTKQMTAEAWLDSVGAIAGFDMGSCDWRYSDVSPRWLPPAMVSPPGQLQGYSYTDAARALGGCPDHSSQVRVTDVGVLAAAEQRTVLADACAGGAIASGSSDAPTLVRGVWRAAFLKDPAGDQLAAIANTLPGGDSATAIGLCEVVSRTNSFLFY